MMNEEYFVQCVDHLLWVERSPENACQRPSDRLRWARRAVRPRHGQLTGVKSHRGPPMSGPAGDQPPRRARWEPGPPEGPPAPRAAAARRVETERGKPMNAGPLLLVGLAVLFAVVAFWAVPVASNYFLNARATTLQTLLNSGQTLRLFANNITPTPATALSAFTEASYSGYAGISLASVFGSPTKIIDGEYQIQSTNLVFNGPATGSQVVYGWYVSDGTGVQFSGLFSSPITMDSTVTLTLQLSPQTWDYSTAV